MFISSPDGDKTHKKADLFYDEDSNDSSKQEVDMNIAKPSSIALIIVPFERAINMLSKDV